MAVTTKFLPPGPNDSQVVVQANPDEKIVIRSINVLNPLSSPIKVHTGDLVRVDERGHAIPINSKDEFEAQRLVTRVSAVKQRLRNYLDAGGNPNDPKVTRILQRIRITDKIREILGSTVVGNAVEVITEKGHGTHVVIEYATFKDDD